MPKMDRLKAEAVTSTTGDSGSSTYLDLRDSKGKAVNPQVPDVDRKTAEKAAEQINDRKGRIQMKKGGKVKAPVKKYARGGGIELRGKTRGKYI